MPSISEELEAAALALPRAERARWIRQLIVSLDEEDDIEEAWHDEVRQRLESYHRGQAKLIDADEALSAARSRLSE
ncbi:MAG: addiction module protein [Bradymonadaceae bacterium]|nr:addiction module protein [Lujinxingiaceae bacterium]